MSFRSEWPQNNEMHILHQGSFTKNINSEFEVTWNNLIFKITNLWWCDLLECLTWREKGDFDTAKNTQLLCTENTHLLHKGKYHCTADLLFDWLGFGQTSKSDNSFNSTKQLNPNQSNRRSAVQWYFPLHSKWVFSAL